MWCTCACVNCVPHGLHFSVSKYKFFFFDLRIETLFQDRIARRPMGKSLCFFTFAFECCRRETVIRSKHFTPLEFLCNDDRKFVTQNGFRIVCVRGYPIIEGYNLLICIFG